MNRNNLTRIRPLLLCLPATLAGCATEAPLHQAALVDRLAARQTSTTELEAALEWAQLEGLALGPTVCADAAPGDPAFWRARAWTYALPCVEARRRFQASLQRSLGAGLPGAIGLGAQSREKETMTAPGQTGTETEVEVALTFDILGLLNLGPAAAASELSDAELRQALAEVEQAAWSSLHVVDRALVRVRASLARESALTELVDQVHTDGRRIQVYVDHGWLPPGQLASANAMSRRAERRLADEQIRLTRAREALSQASGLPVSASAFAELLPLESTAAEPADALRLPSDRELLAHLPELRRSLLAYATAEARVRRAAADAWPGIRLGPNLRIRPDAHLLGGILDLTLPWPGVVASQVAAALELRELAREQLEDQLRAAQAATSERKQRFDRAREINVHQTPQIEQGTAVAWRAARARFSIESSRLPEWTDRLERRSVGCVAAVDGREQLELARIDFAESVGPLSAPGEEQAGR